MSLLLSTRHRSIPRVGSGVSGSSLASPCSRSMAAASRFAGVLSAPTDQSLTGGFPNFCNVALDADRQSCGTPGRGQRHRLGVTGRRDEPGRELRTRHSRIYLPSGNRTAQPVNENPFASGSFTSSSERLDILASDQQCQSHDNRTGLLDATAHVPGIVAGRECWTSTCSDQLVMPLFSGAHGCEHGISAALTMFAQAKNHCLA